MIKLGLIACLAAPADEAADGARVIYVGGRDLQAVIDAAPPHSTIMADRSREITISSTVTIHKPLTLVGLNAKLPAGLGRADMLVVAADGVRIRDFTLTGNVDSVSQEQRASLITIIADDFIVENGVTVNSARHGVLVSAPKRGGDVHGGLARNIVGRGHGRDVVSIEGDGGNGHFVRNVLVENIRGYGSLHRGAVEVCDGGENITVRSIYAESCVYGVDVQDHGREGQIDSQVTIDGVYVRDCDCAIRTANRELGHHAITMRNIAGTAWRDDARRSPLSVTNMANVVIENVRIRECSTAPSVMVRNCDGVVLRDVTIADSTHEGPAVLVEDCNDALVDGLTLTGATQKLTNGLLYRVRSDETFRNLRIRNVLAPGTSSAGIALENASERGGMKQYVITGNIADVLDGVQGEDAVVGDNVP